MWEEISFSFLILTLPALCGYFYIGNQRRYKYYEFEDLSFSDYLKHIFLPFLISLRTASSTLAADLALPIHIYQVNTDQEEGD